MQINPIKKLIALILLFTASTNIASTFECDPRRDATQADIETLYENASDVVFVQITKGELLNTHISYTAKVIENLKGNTNSEIEIIDREHFNARDITIGNAYIIYLYDNTEIDFCTPMLDLWSVSTRDELITFSERKDIRQAEDIKKTLILSKIIEGEIEKQPPTAENNRHRLP
jgi:hypothetical protein